MSEKRIMACLPATEVRSYHTEGVQMECVNCGQAVHVALVSMVIPDIEVWCLPCSEAAFPEAEPTMAPETRHEVLEYVKQKFGMPDDIAEAVVDGLPEMFKKQRQEKRGPWRQ